ncbi:MAG: GAF domain-containing protein [Glaciecola sp.]
MSSNIYSTILAQVDALTNGENDLIANMANISAVLFNQLDDVNWAGFYLFKDNMLVLGPFQGNPACIRIPMGKGVCGTAAQTQILQLVDDVHSFDGHIACDSASNSEIVVPIVKNGVLIGVLDIDSPLFSRFNQEDAEALTKIVDILTETMD